MATAEDQTDNIENINEQQFEEIVDLLYKLDPNDLKKFQVFNHRFEKIVDDVTMRRSCECLDTIKDLSGVGEKTEQNILHKIFDSATALILGGKKQAAKQLKTYAPHVTQMNLSVDPDAVENPDPILSHLVQHCNNIETLNLNSCNVSAEGLLNLKKMPHLTNLSICFYEEMSEEILRIIFQLTRLKELKICWNQSLPLKAFEDIVKLDQLETLNISRSNFTDRELQFIGKIKKLTTLNCEDSPGITDHGLQFLKGCRSLKNLNLSGCSITDEGLRIISDIFPELSTLDLRGSRITDDATPLLTKLSHLKSLDLSMGHNLIGTFLNDLAKLPSLQILILSHCDHIDFSHSDWKSFESLMILDLSYCHLDDSVLHEVGLIPMLTNVSLAYSDAITLAGVKFLTTVPHLRFLDLVYCGLNEAEVRALFASPIELRV